MENAGCIEDNLMAQKNSDGRDELNLAEFPLCALSHRLRPDQKTLRFEDRLLDKGRGEWITRQLTVTGSDAFGLPTLLDDEVLLGLIQLTRQRDFADRKVPFTRHQLLRLLDWKDDSKNYQRLESSLNRWTGVTLYYQKAWWNKARQCWVDEKFHVLDNVWLCHRGEPLPDTGLIEAGAPTSAFVWNEVIFRSFRAGNLKSIDFEFFKSLNSAVAKRLYRFLDKRFWHRDCREFHVRELACQHLGLSPKYDSSSLKRKLLAGVHELEARGYLAASPDESRFRKLRAGDWLVTFTKGKCPPLCTGGKNAPTLKSPLTQALTARGVSADTAAEITAHYATEIIEAKLAAFDWLANRRDPRVSRNPAGFLVSSIKGEYGPPKGYSIRSDKARSTTRRAERKINAQKPQSEDAHKQLAIESFWQSLPPDERRRLETEALTNMHKLARGVIERGGPLALTTRKAVLDAFVLKKMAQRQ